jgi:hypothetical protein
LRHRGAESSRVSGDHSKIFGVLARKQGTNLTLLAGAGSAAVFAWAFWWWRQRRGGHNTVLLSFAGGGRRMDDTVKQLLGLCFPCCFPRTSPPIFTALDAAVNQGSLDPVRAELASRPGCVNHPRREDGALPLHVAVRCSIAILADENSLSMHFIATLFIACSSLLHAMVLARTNPRVTTCHSDGPSQVMLQDADIVRLLLANK